MLDEERFPTLAAYLERLPEGLDSYPEAWSKGTLLRSAFEGLDVEPMLEGLPPRLVNALLEPPPSGVWVPAVLADAIFHVVVDRHYPDERSMLRWTHDRIISTIQRPMYRALVRVAGPAMFLRMAAQAHGLIQKGTELEVALDGKRVQLVLTFPPFLHSHRNLLCNVALVRGLVELTGGHEVRAEMISEAEDEARYECTWT